MSSIKKWKRSVCKVLIILISVMSFLPYIPEALMLSAAEHNVEYNNNPAYHYDGTLWEPGQWYGYYIVGGYLFSENTDARVQAWDNAHIPAGLPIALTNFKVLDAGVKLNTTAFCLKPIAPNWPSTIQVYEITPELCNEFSGVSETKITERDIDALYIATKTLGLTRDAVNISNEVYTAMRFVCWYIGKCGWQSKAQFMAGINDIKGFIDNTQVNRAKFVSLCEKVSAQIDANIGDFDTGQTAYMPSFAGRYSNQAPVISFTDTGSGAYEFTYNFQKNTDKYWEYKCPAGVTVEYTASSVTFKSTVPEPSGIFEGSLKAGSSIPGIVPAGGILICKSDDDEAQDMLIPYGGAPDDLTCYFTAQAGGGGVPSGEAQFPDIPDVEFYRYDETFEAHYRVEGEKYDSETNQKLANAEFEMLEQSPSGQPPVLDNYWGSRIETWNGWRRCRRVETDSKGHFSHSDTRRYDYTGTYCGGHDEQRKIIDDYKAFIEQCEAENAEAEGGGEGDGGDPDGSGGGEADKEPKWDTEAMREHLAKLEEGYAEQVGACEEFADDPVNHFFHSESGSDIQQSDMTNDKQDAYDAFISLEYDYTVREIRAHSGYMLHGKHNDDNPISIIRTPASESGGRGYVILEDNRGGDLPDSFENAVGKSEKEQMHGKGAIGPAGELKKQLNFEDKKIQPGESQPGTASPVEAESVEAEPVEAGVQGYAVADVEDFEEWAEQVHDDEFSSASYPYGAIPSEAYAAPSDATPSDATPSDAAPSDATLSDATPSDATPSDAAPARDIYFQFNHLLSRRQLGLLKAGSDSYTVAAWEPEWRNGTAGSTDTGPEGKVLFTWHIWDHRMEGQVHINKRDIHLAAGQKNNAGYDSYGDSQGDATLEGAVYGLYAAQDIIHPDGKTGKVFSTNELVSMASTDKNGDASFLVITESSPTSESVTNNYDGTYTNADNPAVYQNNLALNGGRWIGRPLILGRYYIKEIGRSEGYELSVTGNLAGAQTNYGLTGTTLADNGTAAVDRILAGGGNTGTGGSIIEIKTEHALSGVELYLYNYPADTKFGIMRTGTAIKPGQTVSSWEDRPVYTTPAGIHVFKNTSGSGRAYYRWNYNHTTGKYERFETDMASPVYKQHQAGDVKKDSYGNPVPVRDSSGNIQYTTIPESKTVSCREYQPWAVGGVMIPETVEHVRNTANDLLKEAGYYTLVPSSAKAPWFSLELAGTEVEQVEQILTWFKDHSFYNAAHVERITENEGVKTALLRYDYLAPGSAPAVLYGTDLYVKELIPEGNGLYYYVPYDSSRYIAEDDGTVTITQLRQIRETITMDEVIEDHINICYLPEYETYAAPETILDDMGNPVPEMESVPEIWENTTVNSTKTIDFLTDIAEYDPDQKCLKVLIRPGRLTEEEKNGILRIETVHTGMTSASVHGQTLQTGEYLKYVMGVSAAASVPSEDWTGTYIKDVLLTYDGQCSDVYEDAGTGAEPVGVEERIIRQKIKVAKDIQVNEDGSYDNNTYSQHEDWFTRLFGGLEDTGTTAGKMNNFRFKVYLKSNLERLYRDEDGMVTWQSRKGETLDMDDRGTISGFTTPYPELVQKIYTKAPHKTDPLFKDSRDAVTAGQSLYSYKDGLIGEEQNPGYVSLLETTERIVEDGAGTRTVSGYNYEKFFDAIAVANHDKWDDQAPSYTSWQPIGNEGNRTDAAIENAKASDMVRQFAIDWYLKAEIEKLNRKFSETGHDGSPVSYTSEFYDQALNQAIRKAENYLKPFFCFDLDEIYSIEWDSAMDGGPDKDKTTLAANLLYGDMGADSGGCYYGISEYLPYGTYVVVEQQPRYANFKDFPNRHYQIDAPKEVTLPSVYAGDKEFRQSPEVYNSFYYYQSAMAPEDMLSRYHIRFQEENYKIQAHSHDGDFQVYKYGLDIDSIKNGVGTAGTGDRFALTQEEFKPDKNYYNPQDDRSGGEIPYYLTEGQSGRTPVSKYYRYSSLSENRGLADAVPYQKAPEKGSLKEEYEESIQYRDHVPVMKGVQTAYEGTYASMLVPWSVTAPGDAVSKEGNIEPRFEGESSYKGFAYTKLRNRFYGSRLRIEKLDSETHEPILHDDAIFSIYAARREDSPDGTGRVIFYEKDTTILGSREFLTAMGAANITPFMRNREFLPAFAAGTLYSGLVPAGTPVCKESEQIILKDNEGGKTGEFKAFTTTRDGPMKDGESGGMFYGDQNTGYLETPQPLGAGVYVLCEVKPPSGYVRTKPIAIEIYSDAVTYYKEGNRDSRVAAAVYEYPSDHPPAYGSESGNLVPMGQVYVENVPIRLTVEKVKESSRHTADTTKDKTVTYKVSGRVDGSLTRIGNNPSYEYAYENGDYLGYAWQKGTLEYLKARREAGEKVDIVYNGRSFAGYGYITRQLETADDSNPYVTGAMMTLFEAIELKPTGDSEDYAYEGLVVERSAAGNISRMYVKQGYAGRRVEFVEEAAAANPKQKPSSCWTAKYVERGDTDILYYDLDRLDLFMEETVSGETILYGYDRDHARVPIHQLEADKAIYKKTDLEPSIFAFKGGLPYLEFAGGDFTKIKYSEKDKSLTVGPGTVIYHVDRDGSRDAQVDPHTGMAFVCQTDTADRGGRSDKILVWPIHIARNEYGSIIARDKITTSRIATVGENQSDTVDHAVITPTNHSGADVPEKERPSYTHRETGYISGSWEPERGEESHRESTLEQNPSGNNRNNEILVNDNNGSFFKKLKPVYDEYGLAEYYQQSGGKYQKSAKLYDRNDDPVRDKESDHLNNYHEAAYTIEPNKGLQNADEDVYHRAGENYILENTWITSDKTPNDPFHSQRTDGQPDILKRVPAGTYIMEELRSPDGYLKAMPVGLTVEETAAVQKVRAADKTTKIEISKVDAADALRWKILDMENRDHQNHPVVTGFAVEDKLRYSYEPLEGAGLALYEAEKIVTSDLSNHPKGWYLKKKSPGAPPLSFQSTSSTASSPQDIMARWTTGKVPVYLEGIPEGYYLLEELDAPSGFVKSRPLELYVANTAEVQLFSMPNDHTKLEIEKYTWENQGKTLQNGAAFTLYMARTDDKGNVIYENGSPQYDDSKIIDSWTSSDAAGYTETVELPEHAFAGQTTKLSGFMTEFETMYRQYGTAPGTFIRWSLKRQAVREEASDGVWRMEDGRRIIEDHGRLLFPEGVNAEEKRKIEASWRRMEAGGETDQIITWLLDRSARYVTHTQTDSTVSPQGGVSSRFPTSAVMIYETDDGQKVRIAIYQENMTRRGRDFTFEYQFDYRRLNSVNNRACSYLTAEGVRRFDYLPVGDHYVLVETMAPAGYEKAEDRLITILPTGDIQRYSIENRTGELLISKTWQNSGRPQKELPGATLAIYRAAADNSFVQDPAYLVDRWITGADGVYGESDYINGRIPKGYQKGDLKPHGIRKLEEGVYYLVELKSPPYYIRSAPIRLEYRRGLTPQFTRVINEPVTGRLEIIKQSASGRPLTGVALEIGAYRNGEREAVWSATVSDRQGVIRLEDLLVGEADETGRIVPYTYRIKEVIPPEGYAVNTEIVTVQFQQDNRGESYAPSAQAHVSLTIRDERTRLYIGKKDFDSIRVEKSGSPGAPGSPFIEGALLAVYEVHGRDSHGNWLYDMENDKKAVWRTTHREERHLVEGLTAGRTYLLKELEAPEGYQTADPLLFTVSQDGRSIRDITGHQELIRIQDNGSGGITVTVKGRYVSRVEMAISDENGSELERWLADGEGHNLAGSGDIREGRPYLLAEHTIYSDGSDVVTSRVWRRFYFNDQGYCHVKDRTAGQVTLAVLDGKGTPFLSFVPKEYFTEETWDGVPFVANADYFLLETTSYSDGRTWESSRWSFSTDEHRKLNGMTMYDRKTMPFVQKIDSADGRPLSGAVLQLEDDDGTVLETWLTDQSVHEIKSPLSPGTIYRIRETGTPPGYLPMENGGTISFRLMDSEKNSAPLLILVDNRPEPPDTPNPPDEPDPPDIPEMPDSPNEPDTPVIPAPPPVEELIPPFPFPENPPGKTGFILAFYEPSYQYPEGLVFRRSVPPPKPRHFWPRTGDDTPWSLYLITFAVSFTGIFLMVLYRTRKGDKRKEVEKD